ncbi:uncharacterized protein LOC129322275 isoform X2 [Prosopis cineraria]|uniref:uncharacterized protein LOC129322275 isoform X2 n=1 Tax=Prosopis cineraria TaxID=364024 RepID=UPI0024100098|nr:uncharacterized protein LOC129322275 isoform X2 [Prosopis cineraria]
MRIQLQPQCSGFSNSVAHQFGLIPLSSLPVSFDFSQRNRFKSAHLRLRRNQRMVISAANEQSSSVGSARKRKVVEHICLLKAKQDLSDEEEKDMLDYLYTTQYQMGGVVAISLGRISASNPENYTHGLYMRFQRRENLEGFYENPFYLKVLKEHVLTYCHGLMNVDYESEVEDEMLSIFRKGEEFNYGVEFVLLISFRDGVSAEKMKDALTSLSLLTSGSPSLIIQSTQGSNFTPSSKEYTHGAVIRFRSADAFEIFTGSKEYKDMWLSKFQPIIQKALSLHYSVDPVGTEIM